MTCECDQPGECPRHGITKTPKMHALCGDETRPGYWEAWESGSGPGQGVRGAGDVVARAILLASRGRIKPCDGCKQRQSALNALTAGRPAEPSEDPGQLEANDGLFRPIRYLFSGPPRPTDNPPANPDRDAGG